ncbi:MAG: hypothetical protein ACFFDV_12775 [Candidatus Thorarchaeota archaeon]
MTAPYIDSPSDITYQYGQVGNSIVWHSEAQYPDRYEVYKNGILDCNETWDGSAVSYSVDGLSVGTYSFKLCVVDTFGNDANDTVQVTVTEVPVTTTTTTTTTTTPPPGFYIDMGILLVAGIGGAAIVVIALILKLRR